MSIRWSERLEIGIDEIDDQHKEIVEQSNKLLEARQDNQGAEKLEEIFEFLEEYIKDHFSSEEKIQQQYNYPKYKEHKKAHDDFIEKVVQFKKEYNNQDKSITALMKLNKTVLNWIIKHVKKEDQELSKYIDEQN